MPDLWPDRFHMPTVPTPIILLREQAGLIKEKTNGLVEGLITSGKNGTLFSYQFYLVVPSLDNYAYRLMIVEHPLKVYPVAIIAEVMDTKYTASDYGQFVNHLRQILTSQETQEVVGSLLAQVQVLSN